MFERYNQPARRALFFARYEASQLGSHTIDTEHLLLGILKQQEQVLVHLLGQAGVAPNEIKALLYSRIGPPGPYIDTSVEIPFSENVKQVFEYTAEEASILLHRHVGTEHLLLGLLRLERGLAFDILREQGLSLAPVRDALVIHVSATAPTPPLIARMLSRRHRDASASDAYLMTTVDGPHPGLRPTDDGGFGGFAATSVGFSTLATNGLDGGIHSIGPISMSGASLSQLISALEEFLGRSVIDDTGLSGTFDITLQGEYHDADALIAALRNQLGLLLTLR
jgi:Protein of unknown function (DUF3738)/Clp amino terminal domain, pathogenicity island component